MNRKKIQQFSLILVGLFLFTSCVTFEEVKISDIKSIQILEAGKKSIILESEIKISNPNFYSIQVTESLFDVYIKNQKIGTASIDSDLKLGSNSDSYQKVRLVSTYDDSKIDAMASVMGAILFGSKEIEFKVDGYVEGKAMFITKRMNLSHSGKVPLSMLRN